MQEPVVAQPPFLFSIPLGQPVLTSADHVAVDSSGNIYVTQKLVHKVVKLGPDGSEIWRIGSGGSGDGQFVSIAGVAVDGTGNVYVVDINNGWVQKFASTVVKKSDRIS